MRLFSSTSFGGINSNFVFEVFTGTEYGQIFDNMLTSYDIVSSIQLSINCNLTVCFFFKKSRHDIKNLTASSYSVPLKTPKPKLEVIPLKDLGEYTF